MGRDPEVSSLEVRAKVDKALAAFRLYQRFTQQQVDNVVEAMAAAGRANAKLLAEMAVEETKYGNVKDKIAKNLLNADLLPRAIRGVKTVGLLRELPDQKVVEIGVPVGVVAAVLPTTNPTSTVIYKCIICLKAGNAVVISPHPRAAKCTCYTAELLHRAAVEAGAPEGIIQCLENPTIESTLALMKHERVAMILSTGGHGIVKAAYSSGKPAFGVGPGNVPVYLERSADAQAVARVVEGKAFDYGTVCSSEQALVAEEPLREAVLAELKRLKAYLCDDTQTRALAKLLIKENFRINPECVGQSPQRIAQMAGFTVPADTSILVVTITGVGKEHPLSVEKLSPVLAVYFVRDHAAALDACEALLRFGGLGHTCVIHSKDEGRIREFAARMPAFRVLVNTNAPGGSTGMTTNLLPSMTLGCGAMAGNITGDNVGPQHLINIKRLAYAVRTPEEAITIPEEWKAAKAPEPRPEPVPVAGPAPAAAVTPARPEQQTVAEAVERYLSERGIVADERGAIKLPAQPAAPEPRTAALASVTAQVVDRFLAARKQGTSPVPAAPPAASSCGCAPAPKQSAPASTGGCGCGSHKPKAEAPASREPEVAAADFVCENDVRAAIQKGTKIYVGPKTIVTPAARDLGQAHGVLVAAHHS
ncbi:MAG TPA: aldehyde dehydrogenase family protein [Bryobacteraceae bacterium]|nr:aldehyde dehydrogenase family protein [Bryobacteraceae bacterium]